MESHAIILFTLSSIFLSGVHSTSFIFKNNCPFSIWPGTLSGSSSSQLSSTGFELASGTSLSLYVPSPWSGRFWGRSECSTDSSGKFSCTTGDCGSNNLQCEGRGAIPPATLVEFTLASNGGQDFYDVSLVDGFNLPVAVTPGNGCNSTSCAASVNSVCPQELVVKGRNGGVVACKSACLAFNQEEFCCSGNYNSPNKCQPSEYSKLFKMQCPQAYSYAYDDQTSTFTCFGGANYAITFCP